MQLVNRSNYTDSTIEAVNYWTITLDNYRNGQAFNYSIIK